MTNKDKADFKVIYRIRHKKNETNRKKQTTVYKTRRYKFQLEKLSWFTARAPTGD